MSLPSLFKIAQATQWFENHGSRVNALIADRLNTGMYTQIFGPASILG
jgi:hypothetical protein